MSRIFLLFGIVAATALFSCNGKGNGNGNDNDGDGGKHHQMGDSATIQSVSIDQADSMLLSYLNSINYQQNDTLLHSIIFNADSLRSYLDDTTHGKIKSVKIMFAHSLPYMRSAKRNQNCGYRSGALTFIIAGYDAQNNYIYNKDQRVMEQGTPCPMGCPRSGSAASDVLPK